MPVSQTVLGFLHDRDIDYDVLTHGPTHCAADTARRARLDPRTVVKAVLMSGENEYVLALLPANRAVNTEALENLSAEHPLSFAEEGDLPYLFRDCLLGAVPAVGPAFGVRTIVDERLLHNNDLYFDGGDHEHLVHVDGDSFARLVNGLEHGAFSVPLQQRRRTS